MIQTSIYKPILSDLYYPADPITLKKTFIDLQSTPVTLFDYDVCSMLIPHAPWSEAGPVYRLMFEYFKKGFQANNLSKREKNTIIILGHPHHYYFEGLSVPTKSHFKMPNGMLRISYKLQSEFIELPYYKDCWDLLGPEQSIEVILPWIQYYFPHKMILPVMIGDLSELALAQLINQYWDDGAFILTSDLSFDLDFGKSLEKDRFTSRAIESLDGFALTKDHLCGHHVLKAFLMVAQERGLKAKTIELTTTTLSKTYSKGLGGHIFF